MSGQEADAKRQRLEAYFEEGSTALMYAAALGHHEVVKLLVAAGADCRLKDKDGQVDVYTPLHAVIHMPCYTCRDTRAVIHLP